MCSSSFFNIVAKIIQFGIEKYSFFDVDSLTEESLDNVETEIDDFLGEKLGYKSGMIYDSFRQDSNIENDIINWCKEKDNIHVLIHILMKLTCSIDTDLLCLDYGIDRMQARNREYDRIVNGNDNKGKNVLPYFKALNDNYVETGITLLPNLRVLSPQSDPNAKEKTVARMSSLNEVLHGIRYVENKTLGDYSLNNVILDPGKDFGDFIKLAFTPTSGKPMSTVFDIDESKLQRDESGNEIKLIGDIKLIEPEKSTENYLKCLQYTRENNIDILFGTEMFGTDELCLGEPSGINCNFLSDGCKYPFLIVTPSLWKDNSNVVYVYTGDGELIGKQYKQFRFSPDGHQKEDLRNIPKEILVVHVKGLGKITFPICADFLKEEYRDLLISGLCTDFLICESYSKGTQEFDSYITRVIENSNYAFWFNSCSATAEYAEKSKCVGLYVIPTSPAKDGLKTISTNCDGKCTSCLFSIEVPLKREGRLGRVDNKTGYSHIKP